MMLWLGLESTRSDPSSGCPLRRHRFIQRAISSVILLAVVVYQQVSRRVVDHIQTARRVKVPELRYIFEKPLASRSRRPRWPALQTGSGHASSTVLGRWPAAHATASPASIVPPIPAQHQPATILCTFLIARGINPRREPRCHSRLSPACLARRRPHFQDFRAGPAFRWLAPRLLPSRFLRSLRRLVARRRCSLRLPKFALSFTQPAPA